MEPTGAGVYILQLSRPLAGRAQFYVGYTTNVQGRLYYHRQGKGACFTREAVRQGIQLELVLWIPGGTRQLERRIKNQKNTGRFIQRYTNRLNKGAAAHV